MKSYFIATNNPGKQREIETLASQYGNNIRLIFPDAARSINVEESGATFEANALLKAQAYRTALGDTTMYYVGDDSGVAIPALNGEPGVFTRRWAGHEMTDEEILNYCMEKMKDLKGDARKADFITVLAVISPTDGVQYFHGIMHGRILEQPLDINAQPGFPFRSIFWVDGIDMSIFQLHSLSTAQRKGFLSHRERAFKQLLERS